MMDSAYTSIIMYAKDQRKNVYPLVFLFFIPRCSVWSIGGFFIFWDMEARQGSIPYNFVPVVSGKMRHAWMMQSPGNRSIFA